SRKPRRASKPWPRAPPRRAQWSRRRRSSCRSSRAQDSGFLRVALRRLVLPIKIDRFVDQLLRVVDFVLGIFSRALVVDADMGLFRRFRFEVISLVLLRRAHELAVGLDELG